MKPYHKIPTVFKRDPATKFRALLMGEYATPELEYLAGNEWVFTEKVDGTNIRVMFDNGELRFGGKTDNASIPAKLVNQLRTLFDGKKELLKEMFSDGACLYGEGYGAGIQKGGGNYSPAAAFVLFDVRIGEWWLERKNVQDVADKLELGTVPPAGTGNLADMVDIVREGFASAWGDFPAEGIVARPAVELFARSGERIITKLKTKDFPES